MMRDGERLLRERQRAQSWSTRFGQFVDSMILAVAPAWAARRLAYRQARNVLSAYRGADRSRLRKDWVTSGGSADADLLPALPDLRERSRDLCRNDAHAAAISETVTVNVVGSGIKPQVRVNQEALKVTPDEARAFERAAEREWKVWCKTADSQGRMDFYEIQQLVKRQIIQNGDVIVLPLMVNNEPWRPYKLALEIIEADRLETPTDKLASGNIREGVELGERGEPIAYWIRKRHPGDLALIGARQANGSTSENFIRYEARNRITGQPNIFHLYVVKRPGQTRGEPYFAPVLDVFKDLADYVEAERVAARVAACFAAFVIKNDPLAAANAITTANSAGQRIQELEPGIIDYLAPGEDVKFAQPNRPGNTFEPFVLGLLRSIGAALGLPLELILKDFSRTNYSSARAALLEARRFFRTDQAWLASHLCQPIYELFLQEAWLREKIPAVDLFTPESRPYWMEARWIAPGWGWVDPVKEVESSTMAIDANLSTLAEECASQGRDWEEVLEQRKREQDKAKELGITAAAPAPPKDPKADPNVDPEAEKDPETEKDPNAEEVYP